VALSRSSLIISVLIVASGWCAASWLHRIDQDLRIIYSEHTLAVTDLGRIYADLIRYRSTILRAVEAHSSEDFSRIITSLPVIRIRMEAAVQRYIEASNKTTAGERMNASELAELKAVEGALNVYLTSSEHTIGLLESMWKASIPTERERLRKEAEHYAATIAGSKLIDATFALDELLTKVGQIAGTVRKEGEVALRIITLAIMAGTLGLIGLILLVQPQRRIKPERRVSEEQGEKSPHPSVVRLN
jgi:hypothetical protein